MKRLIATRFAVEGIIIAHRLAMRRRFRVSSRTLVLPLLLMLTILLRLCMSVLRHVSLKLFSATNIAYVDIPRLLSWV